MRLAILLLIVVVLTTSCLSFDEEYCTKFTVDGCPTACGICEASLKEEYLECHTKEFCEALNEEKEIALGLK